MKEDSRIQYMNTKIRIFTATQEEYKEVIKYAEQNKLEFFTYNPLVTNSSKCILKGLPPTTGEAEIKLELEKKEIKVSHVKQLVKSTLNEKEEWIRKPLSIWIITYVKESHQAIFGLNGLLNFKTTTEEQT